MKYPTNTEIFAIITHEIYTYRANAFQILVHVVHSLQCLISFVLSRASNRKFDL